jgi:hypothetical protein
MKQTKVYDTFWRFAAARQDIFFQRLRGLPAPWTSDPILMLHRFTNVYRAADRVSQFLIRHVIYDGDQNPAEVFFRVLLFRLFNRIETWELLVRQGGIPQTAKFSVARYDRILSKVIDSGQRIYSAAYIIPPAPDSSGRKHRGHLHLASEMIRRHVHDRLTDTGTMREAFEVLHAWPMLGNFLAYQLLIDLNYSSVLNFSEMDFVVPGPGAMRGIAKCFDDPGTRSASDVIKIVAERQEEEFRRRGLNFRTLWGRRMQLVDCQNVFCEVDKYARLAHPDVKLMDGRTRIKQRFRPATAPMKLWFPPKWGLNELLSAPEEGYAFV